MGETFRPRSKRKLRPAATLTIGLALIQIQRCSGRYARATLSQKLSTARLTLLDRQAVHGTILSL